jgi:DNA-binding LytR/AlgR family response regulator
MPDISGLDFIRAIQGRSKVILTTAYSEFVTEGFELEVEDYLLKPIPFPRFLKAVQRIQQAPSNTETPTPEPGVDDYFFVKTELKGKMLRVNFSDIDYIESMKNYVAIHHSGVRTLALLTMKDLEDRLPPARFMRIHRSFIIPVDRITAIEGNMVMLRNVREGILLGETYRPAFLEKMRGKMLQ